MSWRYQTWRRAEGQSGANKRIKFLAVFFIVFAVVIVGRMFDLQVLRGGFYAALAAGQHELYQRLFPERGSIYVSEWQDGKKTLFPLVSNQELPMLYAVPKEMENEDEAAQKIIETLGLPDDIRFDDVKEELFKDLSPDLDPKLAEEIKQKREADWWEEQTKAEIEGLATAFKNKESMYKMVRHRLTEEQVEKIKALNIKGLYFKDETWRFYPESGIGGHVLGFWGFKDDTRVGSYGLEGYFDDILSGKIGEIHSERDALGNLISLGAGSITEKTDGSDLILTIDRAIQYKTCQSLYQAAEKYQAESGAVMVLDSKTGAVLAMCGYPDYNPDKYNEVESIGVYNNPAIFGAYEPGSIFKSITMAAALDVGKVEPDTTYEDTGGVVFGPYTIKNFNDKVYGRKNMTEVLENSINTGAIFAMEQATSPVFTEYVKNFGFGQLTGIELNKEVPGDISNLSRRGDVYAATASFGQGIMSTPLQMVAAYAAIANGGKLMKPYIVSQIVSPDGTVKNFEPQEVRQVISAKTAAMLSGMLVSVVESGHAKTAAVAGYRVAGKTGTAQVARSDGRGYSSDVAISFVGFAPFSDPKFTMITMLYKPQWGKEAVVAAAPLFADIAKFILQYYNIPYDKTNDPKLTK